MPFTVGHRSEAIVGRRNEGATDGSVRNRVDDNSFYGALIVARLQSLLRSLARGQARCRQKKEEKISLMLNCRADADPRPGAAPDQSSLGSWQRHSNSCSAGWPYRGDLD